MENSLINITLLNFLFSLFIVEGKIFMIFHLNFPTYHFFSSNKHKFYFIFLFEWWIKNLWFFQTIFQCIFHISHFYFIFLIFFFFNTIFSFSLFFTVNFPIFQYIFLFYFLFNFSNFYFNFLSFYEMKDFFMCFLSFLIQLLGKFYRENLEEFY